jgi:superfamily II DNA or RNA helicase
MSGTPVENQLFDLYPIFKLIDGGHILGGQKFFQTNFIKYEDVSFRFWSRMMNRYVVKTESKAKGFKNDDYLHKLIKPMIIRKKLRLKVDLYPTDIFIDPSKEMLKCYDDVKLEHKGNASAGYHAARQFLCDTSSGKYKENPKLEKFQEILEQTDEKIVVFSFYKCTIRMLEEYLSNIGQKCFKITGDEKEDALTVIQQFKNSDRRFLLCTDKVNFGHNIQFCRYMVQWEKPFKPTTEEQRIGRLYRTGQENDVHVYSFIVNDTVEEKIHEQFLLKKEVIQTVVETLNDKEMQKIEAEIEKAVMKEFS